MNENDNDNNQNTVISPYSLPCYSYFISTFYNDNQKYLHGNDIDIKEWENVLSENDPDEAFFIVLEDSKPCAWFKINGISGSEVYLSMLVVSTEMKRKGIGRFSVNYSEEYVVKKGFKKLSIYTTEDNIAAQKLYESCGYDLTLKDSAKYGCTIMTRFKYEKLLI